MPIWAAILIMLWPPLHIAGLFIGGEVLEVIGAVLQAIGFAGVAGGAPSVGSGVRRLAIWKNAYSVGLSVRSR